MPRLSILCQSPVSEGMSPAQAVNNTVDLAREADALGFHRFWVAEHHSDKALASSAPEVMIARIAGETKNIRVGAGGVLLPYYRPYKVVEQFNLLAALFPGRIDLGMGRGGGSEGHAAQALGVHRGGFERNDELLAWLADGGQRPHTDTFASPSCPAPTRAQPWVLGTSPSSAQYAGKRGLPYAFGGFLDPRGLMPSITAYHQSFRPSAYLQEPLLKLVWVAQAAATTSRAKELTRSAEHWFVESMLRGKNPPFQDAGHTAQARYTPMEEMAIAMHRELALVGTGAQVLAGARELAQRCHAQEVSLVTICFDHAQRVESYRCVAAAR